ncbi:MAG: RHS repeat protein [Verrucomicrobia bacterium]|nr:RHS repeat protein [Verrucomicrobiota bacterium]
MKRGRILKALRFLAQSFLTAVVFWSVLVSPCLQASFTYDAQGNRLSVTDPLNNTTTFTYSATGRVLTTTDPRGKITTNTYDASDNLTRVEDALHNVTEMTYDARGNLTQTKDALGNLSQNEYDSSGNLTKTTSLNSQLSTLTSASYSYDANGNQFAQTTTRTTPTGVETLTTTRAYDAANRVTETTDPDGSVSRVVYNEIGKQSKTVDFSHTLQSVRHTFPALRPERGRLLSVPLDRSPSLHHLRRWNRPTLVRQFHRYYATVRLPRSVHVRRMVCHLP